MGGTSTRWKGNRLSVTFTWTLPHDSRAPAQGRWHLRELASNAIEAADAELVVTELITNAWKHGYGEITLRVEVAEEVMHIEVCSASDDDPRATTLGGASEDAVEADGRGLLLIEGLAKRWGFDRRGSVVCVWADVSRVM